MKILKYIALCIVSLMMFSCGENLEEYKEKALDVMASKFETTKDLFVKDYEAVIDSMSVQPLTVEDSLALLAFDFNLDKSKIDKKLKEKKEKLNKYRKKSWDSLIKFTEEKIQMQEKELAELTAKYNEKVEYYSKMDKEKVLAKAFCCRFSIKAPLVGAHKTLRGVFLFSPDGEHCSADAPQYFFNYFRDKALNQ